MTNRRNYIGSICALLFVSLGLISCTSGAEEKVIEETDTVSSIERFELRFNDGQSVKEILIDDEITTWLNSSEGRPEPKPKLSQWNGYVDELEGELLTISTSNGAELDLLEILLYPNGLDDAGTPIGTKVVPICGPQAATLCNDSASGDLGFTFPVEELRDLVGNTEHFAIAGIALNSRAGGEPTSFMGLLRAAG